MRHQIATIIDGEPGLTIFTASTVAETHAVFVLAALKRMASEITVSGKLPEGDRVEVSGLHGRGSVRVRIDFELVYDADAPDEDG